ncbi:MAG: hypothetical protein ACM3X4_13840 [Ignavibacteriales bacterium]
MILSLKNPRHVAVIVVFCLFLAAVALLRIDESLEYREVRRVELSWGDGEGQIPVSTSRDGTLFGIRCFCNGPVGVTFVADSERGRILKYDAAGELVEILETGRRRARLDDMTVLPTGTLLIADNSTGEILAMPAEGQPRVLWSGARGEPLAEHIESIQADRDGVVYASTTLLAGGEYRRRLVAVDDTAGQGGAGRESARAIAEVVVRPAGPVEHHGFEGGLTDPAVAFRASIRDGFYIVPVGAGSPVRLIRRFQGNGSLSGEFRVEVTGPGEPVTLAGDDGAGRVYAGISLGTPSGRIRVYNRDGALCAEVRAPYEGKMRSTGYARVDWDGNISVLEAGEHGATIRHLAPVRRKSLARR